LLKVIEQQRATKDSINQFENAFKEYLLPFCYEHKQNLENIPAGLDSESLPHILELPEETLTFSWNSYNIKEKDKDKEDGINKNRISTLGRARSNFKGRKLTIRESAINAITQIDLFEEDELTLTLLEDVILENVLELETDRSTL